MALFFKKLLRHDYQAGFDFLMIAAMLAFASVWAWNQFMKEPPWVDPAKYPIRGIDVSAHNGMMNLDAAASEGVRFVFIKASEGEDFRDENFRLNYEKAWHAGLKIGAYHFFRFDRDGVSQAINLLKAIGDRELDLGIAIDVEEQGNPKGIDPELIQDRLTAMTEYLNLRGYRVMFYSNRDGYYDYIQPNHEGYPLWICGFTRSPVMAEWQFWQYYHHGKVKGIRGDVDLDVFGGSEAEWEDYLFENKKIREAALSRGQ